VAKLSLEKAAKVAFAQFETAGEQIDRLPNVLQLFLRVYCAQGVIDNGGLQYFFESDWPNKPPYSEFSDAYRQIGAVDCAEALDRAVALFGFENPHLDMERRQHRLEMLCDEDLDAFSDSDNVLFANKSVYQKLVIFATQNLAAFTT
jgi:hypothetical protein